MSEDTTPAPAEPRRLRRPGAGRPPSKTAYATLYRDLLQRMNFVRDVLAEAAEAEGPTAHALIAVALRTIREEQP